MKLAFVFPGQGSQSVGMLDSFVGNAVVDDVLTRASAVLGQDLALLIAEGPAETLNLTVNTQPALLATEIAMYRAWEAAGGRRPEMVAGHSLGEYAALTVAGALTIDVAIPLVRLRATAMQEAVPVGQGGMAAILGLPDEEVRQACSEAAQGEVVEAVNFNAPAQVVIAGHKTAVDRACDAAKKRGAKRAVILPVSAPFHSSLLQPASVRLRQALQAIAIARPEIPVVNNVDVVVESQPERIVDALARQAAAPVRWVETIEVMAANGVTHVVECGPGRVLSGLVKRIAPTLECLSINDAASLDETLTALRS